MATDAKTDQAPAALFGDPKLIEALHLNTKVLLALHDRMQGIPEKRTPFRIKVPNAVGAGGATALSGAQVVSANRGEILTVQNSTAAPVTLHLIEDVGGDVLNVTIPANDYKALTVPFFGRLFALSGAGVIISGNVFE